VDIGKISEDLRMGPLTQSADYYDTSITMLVNAEPDKGFNTEWFGLIKAVTPETDLGLDMRPDRREGIVIPMEPASGDSGYVLDTLFFHSDSLPDPAGDNFDWTIEKKIITVLIIRYSVVNISIIISVRSFVYRPIIQL